MKMKYPEYNYQKDTWSKINKFLDSINIIKKDKNKNNKNINQNNNNNNKTVLTEFCNNNCKINNSNNGDNSFHSFNDNYYKQEQQQQYYNHQQQQQQQYYNHQQQNQYVGNIDITKDSPNSQKYYLEQSPNRQDDRVDYWFKQPEDWEINLKILYQLKWRKQMTPCFKRYKVKTREKITYDHFKV
ncbi:hypothetical protein ACTFIW_011013 [Dictyostelium discoideum]